MKDSTFECLVLALLFEVLYTLTGNIVSLIGTAWWLMLTGMYGSLEVVDLVDTWCRNRRMKGQNEKMRV